ncbi:lyase family protein [Mycobacterium montefiorense]|uniref:3-carboxy-cis,cis-muconate cycloisomerase n=1 Tax=Mycobacterium montefiorense TaxID=154654 RepID=A0AA37PS25_9MYCO|nr:lyase family protein [Mycobacterium montefiorense]GBG38220.1 3-carboxy-cis,cis-muconate cycloisomerase [Mycobacterium montefiorense]GKU37584.1 3-carboxy-cis,cis-muconate cycloisomerase [Mycobacterium montefiorense]GKU41277.1 3-carboxy-cis,cis-muconate cycloisomerase [Mycobacterium montefiorense]GKU44500.1 3-carboxy-cis,cis-muconate cycloisomerase [Mycobacterium montefiorense]GKU52588.1 3-carboxy-cis,cis-muconate cycloisomerase [Mycobacterium montefiorense]
MTNLLWPGDHRAGEHLTDQSLLRSMVAVESAWLSALAAAGLAPAGAASADLSNLVDQGDMEGLAVAAEDRGNPIVGLVELLRERAEPAFAPWIHRGLTSQDVVDTALMLGVRAVVDELRTQLCEQVSTLAALADLHRATPMVARTLTQQAAPTTFGAKAAGWCNGVIDACEQLCGLMTPIQVGGAVGTWSATTELATLLTDAADPAGISERVMQTAAAALGLGVRPPWHATRTPVTAAADAFLGCTDSWGRIASDVVTLARPEIGELSEPAAGNRGGSSSMPHKRNPVLSILIRRTAISVPQLAATLHTAAALANDERPDGAWHAEWDTLRTLARRTLSAGSQCGELLAGLVVHAGRMAENLSAADVLGEQRAIADLAGKSPTPSYFGAVDRLIDASLARAERISGKRP